MQTDEEVGKIAQATPIVLSKALDLFVQDLVKHTVEITKEKNGKTMTVGHLKQCVTAGQEFDFLQETVQNVPEVEPKAERRGRPRKADGEKKKQTKASKKRKRESEDDSQEASEESNDQESESAPQTEEMDTDHSESSAQIPPKEEKEEKQIPETASESPPASTAGSTEPSSSSLPKRTSKISDILN